MARSEGHLADEFARRFNEAQSRMEELRPAVEEYQALEAYFERVRKLLAEEGDPPRRQSLSARKDELIELVRDEPGLLVKDLADLMGVSPSRVVQILDALEAEGKVIRKTRGVWALES